MRLRAALAFLACITFVSGIFAQQDAREWLRIVKSSTGFLFAGDLEGASFSFDIPGQDIRTTAEPKVSIDGVFFQFVPVRQSDFAGPGGDVLDAHKRYEQEYLRKTLPGVRFTDDDICKESRLHHQHWVVGLEQADLPKQVMVTVQVGSYVLVIGSAYASDDEYKAMASKVKGLCRSFKVAAAVKPAK